ncbi:unnamed protein product, partial [Timema podura]|nr:unnamed protein product [Timema podura]
MPLKRPVELGIVASEVQKPGLALGLDAIGKASRWSCGTKRQVQSVTYWIAVNKVKFDWVCDDNWKPALAQSLFFVGCVFGTLGLGIMADHIGRLPVLVLANMLALFGNVATYFTRDLPQLGACRFLTGLATDTNFVIMYILVMEYLRPSRRTLGLNLCIGVFQTITCIVIPWIAIASGNWRRFLLAMSLPVLVVPFFYLVVPESASWLVSKGCTKEAIRCFENVASFNGRKISPEVLQKFKDGFDAISRNVEGLNYSPVFMFSVTSVTKLPSSLVIVGLQNRVGRKAMASGAILLSGVFTVVSGLTRAILETGA